MTKHDWTKLSIFAIVAAPLAMVVFSTWRFRLEPVWRMDPIPFGFFVAMAYGVGRLVGSRHRREPTGSSSFGL